MPVDREITRPMLGADQEPTALTWKSTLRSPTASPRGPHRSRSRTRSAAALLSSSMRSRTPSPTIKSIDKNSSLRKSSRFNLNLDFQTNFIVLYKKNQLSNKMEEQLSVSGQSAYNLNKIINRVHSTTTRRFS